MTRLYHRLGIATATVACLLSSLSLQGQRVRVVPARNRVQQAEADAPVIQNNTFQPGERLKYKLRYGIFKAGEAEFSVGPEMQTVNGRRSYYLKGTGRSTGTFDAFYTVRDQIETWVDAQTLLPHKYVRKVHEGDTKFTDNVSFDHQKGVIQGRKGTFEAVRQTRDMLSALYYARCLDLQDFDHQNFYEIPTFLDDKIHKLGMRILGRETVKISMGTFRCIKISPRVVAGTVFKEEDSMILWVTDDENLIPVKIYSPIVVGNINAELTEFVNLRHPLTSKLK